MPNDYFSKIDGCGHCYPGPLPLGYRYEAQRCSEATHEIPISGFDQAVDDPRQLVREIENFVSPEGSRDIPAVFASVSGDL